MDVQSSATKIVKDKCTLFLVISAIILIIVGIVLICSREGTDGALLVKDYTHCLDNDNEECATKLKKPGAVCVCFIGIELYEPLVGDVTLYYELESFDQSTSPYSKSRDDNQLSGQLSQTVSPDCGQYSYDGNKIIAPCGAIADSMFNDTFRLSDVDNYVPTILTSLYGITAEDKAKFRNPPGDLQKAFKDFAKPKNWGKNIWEPNVWEADNTDPNNRGFQNEAFIAWMKTDMKLKPVWRVNNTGVYEHGLPTGNYTMRVSYAYPYSVYRGKRSIILSTIHAVTNYVMLWLGIVLLLTGILTIVTKVVYNKRIYGDYVKPTCEP